MSHPVARRTVRIDGHELVFEKWDDGSTLQPTVFPEDTLQRARRSLTLHQLKTGEVAWFPDSVMNRPQASAVLGVAEAATPSEIAAARDARSRLYSSDRMTDKAHQERAAAIAAQKQLDEAALVLQASPLAPTDRAEPTRSSPYTPQAPYARYGPDSESPTDSEQLLYVGARAAAKAEFGKALLWLGGGAVVTAVTYAASPDGGTFVVFWGAMLYGAWRTLRALYYLANPGALVRRTRR